jgi:hypothetical protein
MTCRFIQHIKTSGCFFLAFAILTLITKCNAQCHNVVLSGEKAPGTEPGVVFSSLSECTFNNSGKVIFRGVLTGAGVNLSNRVGLWSDAAGVGFQLVARTGSQAPGMPNGVTFSSLFNFRLNRLGQSLLMGNLTGPGIGSSNDRGIWIYDEKQVLRLVASEGMDAPGTPDGVAFSGLLIALLNNSGQIAFLADLTGPGVDTSNDRGIWADLTGNGLELVARKGDIAPGLSPATFFSNLLIKTGSLNDSGQLTLFGSLSGSSVNVSNDEWNSPRKVDSESMLTSG